MICLYIFDIVVDSSTSVHYKKPFYSINFELETFTINDLPFNLSVPRVLSSFIDK